MSCVFNIAVSISLEDRLYSSLAHLWKNKCHSDVTLLVGGRSIRAHKVILASRSEFFDRLMFGGMKESGQGEIEMQDIGNVDLFELILEYAYTGSITLIGTIQASWTCWYCDYNLHNSPYDPVSLS